MVYLWCILDTPLLRERNQEFLGLLLSGEIIYIVEIMIKNLFMLGTPIGKHLFNTAKKYYKSGGKKQKDIMKESNVTKSIAKGDIKDEIKRKAFPKGTKPSDFIPKRKKRK